MEWRTPGFCLTMISILALFNHLYFYRVVFLLAFAILALFCAIAMVLRWHHFVNRAKMGLIVNSGSFSPHGKSVLAGVSSGLDEMLLA